MHRCFLPPGQTRGERLVLPEAEAHHALNVLRLKTGDRVVVLNGAGEELLCELVTASKRSAELAVRQRNRIAPLPYAITLVQAVTKGKTMDLIVQKATELGASRVVPILSDRSVPQMDDEGAGEKAEKWTQVSIEAIKQCGAAWLPKIEAPVKTQAYLSRADRFDLALIATLQSDARHPRACFETFREERGAAPRTVAVWVGPEGDFTPAEINQIRGAGVLPITLGPVVLRSETAAMYCLSVLGYELQKR
ncbi:MAG TPA: RsmE family RNA methyltransferase [Verrucomicrobiae bacterium]|nr:RsmE family RNA methyltransferase [Verrucomicrobiae bacterium]